MWVSYHVCSFNVAELRYDCILKLSLTEDYNFDLHVGF